MLIVIYQASLVTHNPEGSISNYFLRLFIDAFPLTD